MVVTTGVSSRRGSQVVGSPSSEGRLYFLFNIYIYIYIYIYII